MANETSLTTTEERPTKKVVTKKAVKKPVKRTPKKVIKVKQQLDEVFSEPVLLNDQGEPIAPERKKAPAPGSRSNYMTFEEAREVIRGEMIPSRTKYEDWWNANKPARIPRFPYRAYAKVWISWNDFLGTDNKFSDRGAIKWKKYAHALPIIHAAGIKSYEAWREWTKVEGNLPPDIPARPDLVYTTEWISWNEWLGNTPRHLAAAKKILNKERILALIHHQTDPDNVLHVEQLQNLSILRERWEVERFDIVKVYWYDQEHSNEVHQVITQLSRPYLEGGNCRLMTNVWEVNYYLQMYLQVVTPREMSDTKAPSLSTQSQVLPSLF